MAKNALTLLMWSLEATKVWSQTTHIFCLRMMVPLTWSTVNMNYAKFLKIAFDICLFKTKVRIHNVFPRPTFLWTLKFKYDLEQFQGDCIWSYCDWKVIMFPHYFLKNGEMRSLYLTIWINIFIKFSLRFYCSDPVSKVEFSL